VQKEVKCVGFGPQGIWKVRDILPRDERLRLRSENPKLFCLELCHHRMFLISLGFSVLIVSVYSGCYNEIPQTE